MCHSVHRAGGGNVGFPACITGHMTRLRGGGGSASRGVSIQEGLLPGGSASGGVCIQEGGSASRRGGLPPGGGVCLQAGSAFSSSTPKLEKWVVRIPLECFLVVE